LIDNIRRIRRKKRERRTDEQALFLTLKFRNRVVPPLVAARGAATSGGTTGNWFWISNYTLMWITNQSSNQRVNQFHNPTPSHKQHQSKLLHHFLSVFNVIKGIKVIKTSSTSSMLIDHQCRQRHHWHHCHQFTNVGSVINVLNAIVNIINAVISVIIHAIIDIANRKNRTDRHHQQNERTDCANQPTATQHNTTEAL